jgi:hypothetical protein
MQETVPTDVPPTFYYIQMNDQFHSVPFAFQLHIGGIPVRVPIGGLAPFPTNILPAFTGGAFSIPTYITYKFKGIQAIYLVKLGRGRAQFLKTSHPSSR